MPTPPDEASDAARSAPANDGTEDDRAPSADGDIRSDEDAVIPTLSSGDPVVGPGVVTLGTAVETLHAELGALVDADYLPGKTEFRDLLCAKLDLSQETAEELVDSLEAAGLVRYVDTKEDGAGWHVHVEEYSAAA